MILKVNNEGVQATISTANIDNFGVSETTILKSNIASVSLIPENRSDAGIEVVRLKLLEGSKYEIPFQAVESFNDVQVTSNKDLYNKTVLALGL